jgi:hypothetical protein
MKRFMLILFIGLELSYYLLIVQTGLVEYLHSDLLLIAPLPIGGIVGSLVAHLTVMHNRDKISFFVALQLLISFFYPNFSSVMLFFLGLSAGALAPLLINELKKARLMDIGLALGLSYSIGTALFNYDIANRTWIAILFSAIILLTSRFLPTEIVQKQTQEQHTLVVMLAWIFLDASLFETLSRDAIIPIWRLGLSGEIIFFHLLGIVLALYIKASHRHKEIFAFVLFGLSYLLYFMQETTLLAAVYPIVISYYNVLILQTLVQKKLKDIGFSMVFIAWLASGAGLVVALYGMIPLMPVVIIVSLMRYTIKIKQKDIQCLKY